MCEQSSLKSLDVACDALLSNKIIRYIGILDKMGNLIFEKQQQGTHIVISDSASRSLYIKSALEILLKKDFDAQIGLLKYNISHRTKIDMITIPVFGNVVMISVEPNENCNLIANNAIMIFEKILKK